MSEIGDVAPESRPEPAPFAKLCGISLEAHAGGVCVGIGVNVTLVASGDRPANSTTYAPAGSTPVPSPAPTGVSTLPRSSVILSMGGVMEPSATW